MPKWYIVLVIGEKKALQINCSRPINISDLYIVIISSCCGFHCRCKAARIHCQLAKATSASDTSRKSRYITTNSNYKEIMSQNCRRWHQPLQGEFQLWGWGRLSTVHRPLLFLHFWDALLLTWKHTHMHTCTHTNTHAHIQVGPLR